VRSVPAEVRDLLVELTEIQLEAEDAVRNAGTDEKYRAHAQLGYMGSATTRIAWRIAMALGDAQLAAELREMGDTVEATARVRRRRRTS
jgi:hypothetical protein